MRAPLDLCLGEFVAAVLDFEDLMNLMVVLED
jgi:hypothetical protein